MKLESETSLVNLTDIDGEIKPFNKLIKKPIKVLSNTDEHTMQISCDSLPYLFIFYCPNYSFETNSFISSDSNEFKFCLELLDLKNIKYYKALLDNTHAMFGFLILNHFLAQKEFYFGYSDEKQQYFVKMILNDKLPNAFFYEFYFKKNIQDPMYDLAVAYQLLLNQQQFKEVRPLLLNIEPSNFGYYHSFWTSKEGKPENFWKHKCSQILMKTPKNYVVLKLPIKSSLYEIFVSGKELILEHIEGAKNSVELILGSSFSGSENLKIVGPEWRINSTRSDSIYNNLKVRVGTYFEFSWNAINTCDGYGSDQLNHPISAEIAGLGISSSRWNPHHHGEKSCGIYQPYDSKYTHAHRQLSEYLRDFEFGQENSSCQIFALD